MWFNNLWVNNSNLWLYLVPDDSSHLKIDVKVECIALWDTLVCSAVVMQYANLDIDLILMFSTVFHFHCAQKHSLPCRRVALRLVSNTFRHSYDSLGCTAILNGATRSDMKVMKHQTGVFGKHESQVDVESGWIKCIWRRSSEEKSSSAFKVEDVWGQKIISDQYYAFQNNAETNPVRFLHNALFKGSQWRTTHSGSVWKKEMRANEWGWTVFC